jgi:hypothetical protein
MGIDGQSILKAVGRFVKPHIIVHENKGQSEPRLQEVDALPI